MIDSLAAALALASLASCSLVVWWGVRGSYAWSRAWRLLGAVQLGATMHALLAVLALARGHHAREPATHLAYLAVSVALLPAAALQVRGDDGKWAAALVALALLVLAVVTIRATTTGRTA